MNKNQIIETVWGLDAPIAEELGLILCDVQFLKEGADWSLRIIVDREEGMDMDACVAMSRAIDPKLDEADPIDQRQSCTKPQPTCRSYSHNARPKACVTRTLTCAQTNLALMSSCV